MANMEKREQTRFLKYGGVEFEALRSPEDINAFVASLSESDRESLQTVVKKLEQAGYIQIPDDPEFRTIDRDYEVLDNYESMSHEEMAERVNEILWQEEDRPHDGQ